MPSFDQNPGGDFDDQDAILEQAGSRPIIHLLNLALLMALKEGASIRIEPGEDRALMIIEGVERDFKEIPSQMVKPLVARIMLMAELDHAQFMIDQSGSFELNIGSEKIAVTVNTVANGVYQSVNVELERVPFGPPSER